MEGNLLGKVISLKNGTGADATPNLIFDVDTTAGQFTTSSAGSTFIGVLLKNLEYVDYVTPDGKEGSIQIDGIVDITCAGTISCGDFVKKDATGKVVTAGGLGDMSGIAAPFVVVGRALEDGTSGSKISVYLNPQIIPETV